MTSLIRYEAARAALAEALSVDEVMAVRNAAERMKLYARQSKDRSLLANATALQVRAERKLGVLIISAKETGQLGIGRPSRSNLSAPRSGRSSAPPSGEDCQPVGDPANRFGDPVEDNGSDAEPFTRTTLSEAGIDKKLSMKAQAWARLGEGEFADKLREIRERIEASGATIVNPKIGGERALMGSRREAIDSLDYFPTPPWATRALVEDVLGGHLGLTLVDASIWEPACGEGHITGVLEEYSPHVIGTDIFDYSVERREAPAFKGTHDFLSVVPASLRAKKPSWVITNPPFDAKALQFVERALEVAEVGVAMFFRSQWAVEGVERYEQLFEHNPPTLHAFFVERVNLCKGRWEPGGSTATAYCWLLWVKGMRRLPPFYIPPGRRLERWREGDEARFTAHPVLSLSAPSLRSPAPAVPVPDRSGDPVPTASSQPVGGPLLGRAVSGTPPLSASGQGLRADEPVKGVPSARREAVAPLTGSSARDSGAIPSHAKTDTAAIAEAIEGAIPPAEAESVSRLAVGRTAAAGEADAHTSPAPFKSTPVTDAAIALYYASIAAENFDLDGFAARLGASKLQVRRRANQLGLSSRERQRAAASAYTRGQHARGELNSGSERAAEGPEGEGQR